MMALKTILNIPWTNVDGEPYRAEAVAREEDAYTLPIIYRATRLRCNSLTRIPIYIYDGDEIVSQYAFEDTLPLRDLLWLSEASLLLTGANYLLKLQNTFEYNKGLQWLNPFSMHTEYRNGEYLFYQLLPDGRRNPPSGYWTEDNFIYMREFHPRDDVGAGISAASVALSAASAAENTNKFLSRFFGSHALPITMILVPEGTSDSAVESIENWFKRKIQKMRVNVSRVLGVKGDIKLEKLTADLNTYDFPAVDKHILEQVSYAFDIPKSLLSSESANFATASVERRIYMEDTIIPRCRMYERHLNPFLSEVNQRIEFAPQELPEMQEDEKDRSQALGNLVAAGVPLRAALDILGYDMSNEAQKLIEESVEKKEERPQSDPIREELLKWYRKSLKRLRSGKSAQIEFESLLIPSEQKENIYNSLSQVKSENDLKTVFGVNNDLR